MYLKIIIMIMENIFMECMIMNLTDVFTSEGKVKKISQTYDAGNVSYMGENYPVVDKSDVSLTFTNIGTGRILLEGELSLTVEIPCDRCLDPVAVELSLDFTKKVELNQSKDDNMFSDEFDESNYIDGYTLDVDKLVYNEVLIGWPTKILCSEDCKGICNVCGQNLNLGTCDCEDTSLDPRMSVIRDLFKNFKEV